MLRKLGPFWVFLLIFALAIVYMPGFTKYLKLKRKETELSTEIKRLNSEIKKLRDEEHLLKTDVSHLEQVVREELGLVKPGETVIKVVEEEAPNAEVNPSKPKTQNSPKTPAGFTQTQ